MRLGSVVIGGADFIRLHVGRMSLSRSSWRPGRLGSTSHTCDGHGSARMRTGRSSHSARSDTHGLCCLRVVPGASRDVVSPCGTRAGHRGGIRDDLLQLAGMRSATVTSVTGSSDFENFYIAHMGNEGGKVKTVRQDGDEMRGRSGAQRTSYLRRMLEWPNWTASEGAAAPPNVVD